MVTIKGQLPNCEVAKHRIEELVECSRKVCPCMECSVLLRIMFSQVNSFH